MVDQLKFISEKLGLLGLLQILVKAPVPKPGETADQYRRRADTYLKTVVDRIEGSFKKGIAVGFKDLQEFTVTDTKANPSGFKELFQINEEQIASGVKMDPSMLGRSYSTTETYAGVVMERTLALLTSYQRLVAQALRRGIWLLALLRGINVTKITVEFAESNLVDQKSREEVREKKLKNARGMYDQGLIDQEGVAQEMGIAEPALPGPRNVAPAPPGEGGEAEEEPRPGDQEEEDDAELGAFGPLIQFLRRRRQAREDAE
jgi:hypothetical protein